MTNEHLLVTKAKPVLYFRRKIPLAEDQETFISAKSFVSSHHKCEFPKLEAPIEMKSVVHDVHNTFKQSREKSESEEEDKFDWASWGKFDTKNNYKQDKKQRDDKEVGLSWDTWGKSEEENDDRNKLGTLTVKEFESRSKRKIDYNEEKFLKKTRDEPMPKLRRDRMYSYTHHRDGFSRSQLDEKPYFGQTLVYNQPISRRVAIESKAVVPLASLFNPIDHLGYEQKKQEMTHENKKTKEARGAVLMLKRALENASKPGRKQS